VRTAVARNARPADIVQPGHIFPLRAQKGGVLTRAGHTEAGCDLARLAGFESASVIVEIMNDDGTMARRPELEAFAKTHNLKIGTIAELIHYRVLHEKTIELLDEGPFLLQRYRDTLQERIHFVLKLGEITPDEPALVRVHVTNTIRDVLLADIPGDRSWNMQRTLRHIAEEGRGVIVLITQNETSDSLLYSSDVVLGRKTLAEGPSRISTEMSLNVGLGSQLLREAGVRKMRLMSTPVKYHALAGFDLEVVEFVACKEDKKP
jgi:3,4-dihydroxy 2-butanone 4-phosphate synthase/GTP cyclohydrolase II